MLVIYRKIFHRQSVTMLFRWKSVNESFHRYFVANTNPSTVRYWLLTVKFVTKICRNCQKSITNNYRREYTNVFGSVAIPSVKPISNELPTVLAVGNALFVVVHNTQWTRVLPLPEEINIISLVTQFPIKGFTSLDADGIRHHSNINLESEKKGKTGVCLRPLKKIIYIYFCILIK